MAPVGTQASQPGQSRLAWNSTRPAARQELTFLPPPDQCPPRPVSGNRFPSLRGASTIAATGKLKYLAGTESGLAMWINDIVPVTAARRLREAA